MTDGTFGRYLASVAERDVDLLLMEEFHVSDGFVGWFCGRCGLENVAPLGAWHSISDTDGETDLLLVVAAKSGRVGVLIENKVAAPEQDRQADRYHLRAARAQAAGHFDSYVTVICAPQRYLEALPAESTYDFRLAYEDIADWFAHSDDRRSSWRRAVMLEAIEQGRRGYTMLISPTNTAFQLAYWEYLRAKHPRLLMRRPTPKGKKSNWIIMKGLDFPKGVQIHHKFDQRVVELGFSGRSVNEILARQPEWPEHILPVQKSGTAALMIRVPYIDMEAGLPLQVQEVETALAAIYELLAYAKLLG